MKDLDARRLNRGAINCMNVIQEKLNAFTRSIGGILHDFMVNDTPQNMYEFADPEDERLLNPREVKEYFIARETLIKHLIEGVFDCVKTGGRINALALDVALLQCKDLFHLDKFDSYYARSDGLSPKKEYLLSLLLFTERYEEHYNVCCYYAQRGEQFYPPPDTMSTFDVSIGMGRSDIKSVNEANGDNAVDVTTSYFVEYDLHYRQFPRLSASHMFINKYTLHMNMESLRLLRYNVLDNEDCIGQILTILFKRFYVLRNQVMHGGATWNSAVNRKQVNDCNSLMKVLVPLFAKIMLNNPDEDWGALPFPVQTEA